MSAKPKTPFVERLPCKLSAAEKELKADALAHAVNKRDALTLEKSIEAQRIAKEIKECDRKIGDLAEEVRNGVEYRHIRVTERKDFARNVVEVIRTDTHEVCGQRAMTANERQAEMFPKAGNGNGGDDKQLALGEAEEVVDDGEPIGPDDDEPDDDDDDAIDSEESAELIEH